MNVFINGRVVLLRNLSTPGQTDKMPQFWTFGLLPSLGTFTGITYPNGMWSVTIS